MEIKTIELEGEISLLQETYPDPMRVVSRFFSDRRASVRNNKYLVLESTVRAQDLARHYANLAMSGELRKQHFMAAGIESHDEFNDDDDDWRGMGSGRLALEFLGEANSMMGELEEARRELSKTGLKESLEENLQGVKKRRRRVFSEHDGDFDLDRKWDSAPFMATLMGKREFPFLELCFPLNMNSGASKKQIDRFNARCLALAEILESVGYRISLVGENWQRRLINGSKDCKKLFEKATGVKKEGSLELTEIELLGHIVIRDSNEYGDIASFAQYTSTEFYRRCMFALCYSPAHYVYGLRGLLTKAVDYNYGQATQERPIPARPGQIVLTHETVEKLFSSDEKTRNKIFQDRVMHTVGIAG